MAAVEAAVPVRFSVALFIEPNQRVGVTGNLPCLGSWAAAVPLDPVTVAEDKFHASVWWADVALPASIFHPNAGRVEFKFVTWTADSALTTRIPDPAELAYLEAGPAHRAAAAHVAAGAPGSSASAGAGGGTGQWDAPAVAPGSGGSTAAVSPNSAVPRSAVAAVANDPLCRCAAVDASGTWHIVPRELSEHLVYTGDRPGGERRASKLSPKNASWQWEEGSNRSLDFASPSPASAFATVAPDAGGAPASISPAVDSNGCAPGARAFATERMASTRRQSSDPLVHFYDPEVNLLRLSRANSCGPYLYALPVMRFRACVGEDADPESAATSRYYLRKKAAGVMHFDRVTTRLWIGTCPRLTEDLGRLRALGVTDIFNLQEPCDVAENFLRDSPDEKTARALADAAAAAGLGYVWLPVRDMCSESRALSVAQAAILLAALLVRRDCGAVYVHCNAGVGRSVAAVAAFLIFCAHVPLRVCNLALNSRRCCAFFDDDALLRAQQIFTRSFGDAAAALHDKLRDRDMEHHRLTSL